MNTIAENPLALNEDRVRRSTPAHVNERIDRHIEDSVRGYENASREAIIQRIHALNTEWDIERVLEVNASTLALSGMALGVTVSKRWLALPAAVMGFLLLHGVKGWCPPLPVLRRCGVRTRDEIDKEKYQLLAILAGRNLSD
jgi:hypothetical protein